MDLPVELPNMVVVQFCHHLWTNKLESGGLFVVQVNEWRCYRYILGFQVMPSQIKNEEF